MSPHVFCVLTEGRCHGDTERDLFLSAVVLAAEPGGLHLLRSSGGQV